MSEAIFSNGRWTMPKDPDDINRVKGDISEDLLDRATTVASVTQIVGGVEVVTPTVVAIAEDKTELVVVLGGLDVTLDALNFVTFRVTCTNGERFDRTIWFVREDH